MSVRDTIVAARSANDFALIRSAAHAWADTQIGIHLRALLAELDGAQPVTEKLLTAILLHGYSRTQHGDGFGDDIHTLVEEIGKRRRGAKEGT